MAPAPPLLLQALLSILVFGSIFPAALGQETVTDASKLGTDNYLEFVDTTCGNEGLTACEAVCATSNWHIANMPSLIGLDSDKAPTTQCGCLSILIHAGNFIMYGGVNGQLTKQSDDYQATMTRMAQSHVRSISRASGHLHTLRTSTVTC